MLALYEERANTRRELQRYRDGLKTCPDSDPVKDIGLGSVGAGASCGSLEAT